MGIIHPFCNLFDELFQELGTASLTDVYFLKGTVVVAQLHLKDLL